MAVSKIAPRRLGRRPVLDGVRGIAILLVMLMHTGLLLNGFIGVDIFFGLSGFLITTLLYEEWDRTGTISFRRFYERRARRLLPALLLLVGAFAVLYLVLHPFTGWPLPRRAATTLLFANNWVAGLGHDQDLGALAPTWSLAQEEQFYLVWPLMLWVMLRLRLRPAAVLAVLLATIVVLVGAVPHLERALPSYSEYYSPLDRGAELLIGCAGAVIWRHRLVPRALRRRSAILPLLVGLACLLLCGRQLPVRWIYLGSALIAVPLIVYLLAREDGLLARVISCRPLRYAGRISYGLYLCNLLIHNLVVRYLPGHTNYFYAPIVIVASFVLAAASWRLVESRVIARGKRSRTTPATWAVRRPQEQYAR
jgi:peptidoglycan/LPS O-acetylase OafA/YrhL